MDPFVRMIYAPEMRVMERILHPLSAYHLAAMSLIQSPYMSGGVPAPSDTIAAVCVCSTRWQDGASQMMTLNADAVQSWAAQLKELNWDKAQSDFREYCDFYLSDLPEVWHEEGRTCKPSALPLPAHSVATVMMYMHGITEDQAWNMPINRLLAYRAAIAENNGYELLSERQRELFKIRDNIRQEVSHA